MPFSEKKVYTLADVVQIAEDNYFSQGSVYMIPSTETGYGIAEESGGEEDTCNDNLCRKQLL